MSQSQDERKELELKYRPLNFNELVGWDKEKESLLSLLNTKRTYLLYGKRGCGKCITKDSFIFTDEGIKSIDEHKRFYSKKNKYSN
jgi:replication-associated recombination protein RarA